MLPAVDLLVPALLLEFVVGALGEIFGGILGVHQFDQVACGRGEIQVQVVLDTHHVKVDGELGSKLYRVTLFSFDNEAPGPTFNKDRLRPGSLLDDRF